MEELLKQLADLYDEQVRYEKELFDRTNIIIGDDKKKQVRDLKEEMNGILREIRLKIRTLEAKVKNQALDEERSFSKNGLSVEYSPWTRTVTSFPGTDLANEEKTQAPRVKIARADDKPKRYRPAQLVMKLF